MTRTLFPNDTGAWVDPTGRFRYLLWRDLQGGDGRVCTFVMLNPSTADDYANDPTIRRCIGFARREKCSRLEVVNLFPLRATDPAELAECDDLRDAHETNLAIVRDALWRSGLVVGAWGSWAPRHKLLVNLAAEVWSLIEAVGRTPMQLGALTANGQPPHPLYLKADTPLRPLGWKGDA